MKMVIEKETPTLQREFRIFGLSDSAGLLLLVAPVLIIVSFSLFWFTPATYKLGTWLSKENGPAELLTFLFLLFGGILGISLAWRLKAKGENFLVWGFVTLFSIFLFLVAMEEISWGQQLFKFETPDSLKQINAQNELTLHNIEGLQGNSEYFHLLFGLAGVIGIWFNLYFLNKVRIPRALAPWFLTIVAVTLFDLSNDFIDYGSSMDYFTRRLSEMNEMLIGFAGFAYIVFLYRKFVRTPSLPISSNSSTEDAVIEQKAQAVSSGR
jgi:hypothetical protein